jgi:hypothetical protein
MLQPSERPGTRRAVPWCVCVPARNEEERLGRLVEALVDQTIPGVIPVVIALNNTTDRSPELLAELARRHAGRIDLHVHTAVFPLALAHAGSARRLAMDLAAEWAGPDGVVLTTDADARPLPDWIAANLSALSRGADIVGGRLILDEDEAIDPLVCEASAMQDLYWAAVRAIEDAIDPRPWDPQPRHGDHTGASLAMSVATYIRAGRIPVIPLGEDNRLVDAVICDGGKLVHPPDVCVRVSPRYIGRAVGGMAACMDRLHALIDAGEEPLLPALHHWRDRALWRREIRERYGDAEVIRRERDLPPMPEDTPVSRALDAEIAA